MIYEKLVLTTTMIFQYTWKRVSSQIANLKLRGIDPPASEKLFLAFDARIRNENQWNCLRFYTPSSANGLEFSGVRSPVRVIGLHPCQCNFSTLEWTGQNLISLRQGRDFSSPRNPVPLEEHKLQIREF